MGMRPGAFLVNTARAGLVDEQALIEALRLRRIGGAGLDVFWHEPLPQAHPLCGFDNVVLTPHLGYVTRDNLAASTVALSTTSRPGSTAANPCRCQADSPASPSTRARQSGSQPPSRASSRRQPSRRALLAMLECAQPCLAPICLSEWRPARYSTSIAGQSGCAGLRVRRDPETGVAMSAPVLAGVMSNTRLTTAGGSPETRQKRSLSCCCPCHLR